MNKEREAWVKACRGSLCANYDYQWNGWLTYGIQPLELCEHQWCLGIVDVLRRIYVDMDGVVLRAKLCQMS